MIQPRHRMLRLLLLSVTPDKNLAGYDAPLPGMTNVLPTLLETTDKLSRIPLGRVPD